MSVAAEPQRPSTADTKGRNFPPRQSITRPASILVVDDEAGIRNFLRRALAKQYGLVEVADSVAAAEELRRRCHFDLLIVDIRLPGRSGLEWIGDLRDNGKSPDVIFITAYADLDTTIAALRFGAVDFVRKPFRIEQILVAVERCFARRQLARENTALHHQVDEYVGRVCGMDGMVGDSPAMNTVCEMIQRVAPTPSSVLIEGETGTGKELAARAIHRCSARRGPFVPINCVAISAELFESELFGHTKGAFTHAHQPREGLFSFANNGTLFLDEISEMPLAMQAKFLRVLESRTIRPVGSDREVPVDVRVIAATNRNLEAEVRRGRFREDLYYRLNVVGLRMPALREHAEDIPDLVDYLAETLTMELGVAPILFDQQELRRLQEYSWPGNVRELRNLLERALLLGRLSVDSLTGEPVGIGNDSAESGSNQLFPVDWKLDEVQKRHMLRVLNASGGNKSEAARRLGVSRKTLERKLCSNSNTAHPDSGSD